MVPKFEKEKTTQRCHSTKIPFQTNETNEQNRIEHKFSK